MDDAQLTTVLCAVLGQVPGWVNTATEPPPPVPPESIGIYYGDIPDEPDRAIGVRVYGGTDDAVVYSPVRRAQLRIRGSRDDKRDADRTAGFAFSLLQGRCRVDGIAWIQRETFGPLGADTNGREERTENYTIHIDNPGVGT